ncbi:phenylacetate--CoA ligase family protein [Gordonia aquimaris]|uniref:Phenylacetate-CoA ligase n=1 Tax=Gordonia aquimaris TaxID=2984863 RepID=A0A9X3I792_9ACTN|nr:hypothetical protein [Gordonia aquimaris]MCX2966870.1 hypothetical protein [Gordonia aquimaris]
MSGSEEEKAEEQTSHSEATTQHPQQPTVGIDTAVELARRAAKRVPAYNKLLTANGVDSDAIDEASFHALPPMTKAGYLKAYDQPELVWDADLGRVVNWSASSGSSGMPTYFPRSRKSLYDSIRFHEQILRDTFHAHERTTLAVNTFAMGTWIAGSYTLMALNGANDLEIPVSVISPGIEIDDAVRALTELAPNYEQVVITGYPPHVKDVLDRLAADAPAALSQDIKLLLAGELITETWRDHLLKRIGKPNDPASIVLIYGTADAGLMGFETALSIAIRRAAEHDPNLRGALFDEDVTHLPTFVEYDPVARYVETDEDGCLLFTLDTTLPLVRYRIKDEGELYDGSTMRDVLEAYGHDELAQRVTDNHFLALYGRPDVAVTFYAVNIFFHNVQPVVEDPRVADALSGYFHMPHPENADLSMTLRIMFELKNGVAETESLRETLAQIAYEELRHSNGEYRTLCDSKKEPAHPVVSLHSYRSRPEFERKAKQQHTGKRR